jgi:ribonucleoside-triphosphate reductase
LNGGLFVALNIDKDAKVADIKKSIEKISLLTPSFKPVKTVAICGECGFKDEPFDDKCPKCKSPYII